MNIFLSWAGEKSKRAAKAFDECFQFLFRDLDSKIYISTSTEKGALWNDRLIKALDDADFGILILTKENCARPSPWMMYEAGVLSKTAGTDHVMTFLLNARASDIPGPVSRFQSTAFDKEDMTALVLRIYGLYKQEKNIINDKNYLPDNEMKDFFGYLYDRLERELNLIINLNCDDEENINEKILAVAEQTLNISRENHEILKDLVSN